MDGSAWASGLAGKRLIFFFFNCTTVKYTEHKFYHFNHLFLKFLFSLKKNIFATLCDTWDFPGGSVVKNLPTSAGGAGLIPGSGRSPGEGNGNPLQRSRLGNPTDRGAWWATVHGVAESQTRLSN